MQKLIIFVLILSFNSAWALDYREQLLQFADDIRYIDSTPESKELQDRFIGDWEAFVRRDAPLPEEWLKDYSWSKPLRDYIEQDWRQKAFQLGPRDRVIKVEALPNRVGFSNHSMGDPQDYSMKRLGDHTLKALDSKTKVIVYAGQIESLPRYLNLEPHRLVLFPSTYNRWGLQKAFVSGKSFADGKDRFVFVIPPSRQQVNHYALLLQSHGVNASEIILNQDDLQRRNAEIQAGFQKLQRELKLQSIDYVVLGYHQQIYETLTQWRVPTYTFQVADGLYATYAVVNGKSLVFLKSDRSLWGEQSAALIETTLKLRPQNVIFMGSAGAISAQAKVYDISVPNEFVLKNKSLTITNGLSHFLPKVKSAQEFVPIRMDVAHGHTNSPMEQSKAYVSGLLRHRIDTIDVEQNLIAEKVYEFNKKNGTDIQFGALNIITDKPNSYDYNWNESSNLDYQNKSKRRLARYNAAQFLLGVISQKHIILRCRALFYQ